MTVYVDELVPRSTGPRCFRPGSCHMLADTLEELHAMARQIGMRRSWFQEKSSPHYDLTVGQRAKAVELGAVEVTNRKMVEHIQGWRAAKAWQDSFPWWSR